MVRLGDVGEDLVGPSHCARWRSVDAFKQSVDGQAAQQVDRVYDLVDLNSPRKRDLIRFANDLRSNKNTARGRMETVNRNYKDAPSALLIEIGNVNVAATDHAMPSNAASTSASRSTKAC